MGRVAHLEATLEQNICTALADTGAVEFVLLDYSSKDGLRSLIAGKYMEYIDRGCLNYYFHPEPEIFHTSHAKNLAHKLARGEIVCSLDADNLVRPKFVSFLEAHVRQRGQFASFTRCPQSYGGSSGRIAFQKGDFISLGGYNEALRGWGWEDVDLIERAELAGLARVAIPLEFAGALKHDDSLRVGGQGGKTLNESNESNRQIAQQMIDAGEKISFDECGRGIVFKNFSDTPIMT